MSYNNKILIQTSSLFIFLSVSYIFYRQIWNNKLRIGTEAIKIQLDTIKLSVVTRIHSAKSDNLPPIAAVENFINNTIQYATLILICVINFQF